MSRNFLVAVAAATMLSACHRADPATLAAPAPEPEHARIPGRVRLTEAQLAQIRVERLSADAPADAIKVSGTVEFNTDRIAKILPPVAGQVHALTVNVGDTVAQNSVLFVLSSREVAAAVADHVASHKDLELAEKTNAMTRDLFEHQAASRIALQQSENELAKAKSKVQQTEEVLTVLGLDDRDGPDGEARPPAPRIQVRSPIAGTIIDKTVTNGQFVGGESAPLMTIADLASVWVQGDVFERDLRHIAPGQRADVTTAAYPEETFSAQVARIAAVVDPQTRTAKVRFLAANPGGRLKPGMFASIRLFLPGAAASLTIPNKAVFVENGRSFAYVAVGSREFVRREIETTSGGADRSRVVRGIAAGDRVVSDGVLLLRQLEADAAP